LIGLILFGGVSSQEFDVFAFKFLLKFFKKVVLFVVDEFLDFVDYAVCNGYSCGLMVDFKAEREVERFVAFFLLVKDAISDFKLD
jgi:hypothetical protein